jgi:tripartite-type tricarboxylate transporter receptor subunit TctC
VPANSIRELIALAKSRPGSLNFASSGNGSPAHLSGELLNSMAGIKLFHVPYKATAQGTADTIGGTIQIAFPSVSSALQHVRAGKLKALGITSAKRSSIAPDIAPISDTLPGYEATIWNGVLAPAGTPAAIIARLNSELGKALNTAEVRTKLAGIGVDVEAGTPAEFGAFVEAEIRKWRGVVKESGMKVEIER